MKLKASNPFVVWAVFGGLDIERNFTLCQLFWYCVLAAPIKFVAIVGVCVFVLGLSIVMPLFGLFDWVMTGSFEPGFFLIWFAAAFLATIFGGFAGFVWLANKRPMPAVVTEAYRGWKDNYCPIVEIEK